MSGHGAEAMPAPMSAHCDVYSIVDEPIERGGTNLGLTPTETLMSGLIACTNVITKPRSPMPRGRRHGRNEDRARRPISDRRGVGLIEGDRTGALH